jgi:hypothetical protein
MDLDYGRMAAQFFAGVSPQIGKGKHEDRQETMMMDENPMMMDENLARLRTHRNNIHRYRRLLATQLTDLERTYIERRLTEEQAAMAALSEETFHPGTTRPAVTQEGCLSWTPSLSGHMRRSSTNSASRAIARHLMWSARTSNDGWIRSRDALNRYLAQRSRGAQNVA